MTAAGAPAQNRRARGTTRAVALVVGVVLAAAGCGSAGGPDAPQRVAAAGEGAGTDPGAPVPDPAPASDDPATSPAAPVEADVAGSDAPSVVAGLDVAELAAVLDAPNGARRRPAAGPVLERVEVAGASAWRLTVPGPVVVGGARAEVVVGERTVGVGVPADDLASLVAVTLDPSGLEAGDPVRIRWPGRAVVEAGALQVVG